MRLLKRSPTGGFELVSFEDDAIPPYAILSHIWIDGQEVTYTELIAATRTDKAGYDKIRFCVARAAADGLEYSWVDTCCIDKSTSVEISTAINSMFRWYQRANKCYVFLSDVIVPDEVTDVQAYRITWTDAVRRSRWFTRGWTLQELLAPPVVEFFSKEGKRLGCKISLEQDIHEITSIPIEVLRGQSLAKFSVEERMSWAAKRTTTVKEDKVYCLLGLFGVFLPLIYGEGEEYATKRLIEEIEKRQKGQGTESLHNVTVSSSLPFPRNELFVGRENLLQALDQHLPVSNVHHRMTIYGLGGCGKSALAVEFGYRVLATDASHLVFWVPAISRESFELAYHKIGVCLRIPGITDDDANVKQLVMDSLSSDSGRRWLMIVDNADDPGVLMRNANSDLGETRLHDYLPHSARGRILFTTRSRNVAGDLTPGKVLDLQEMSRAEARQLLARRIVKQALLNDAKAVDELLSSLEHLPLAIVQAAAFISNNDVSVSEYTSLLRERDNEVELFGQHFEDTSRYREMESTIAKTWHISFNQVHRQDPLAAEYLSFMACIDRINIPQSLLPRGGSVVQQVRAIGMLKGYAFITERQQALQEPGGERFFDMHRLVHMASGWWLDVHGEQSAWAATAARRLEELIPFGGRERREVWTAYLSHAIHVARLEDGLDDVARASLLQRVGQCQGTLGYYSTAASTHRQALALIQGKLGQESLEILSSMNSLATVLGRQGKYVEAEVMIRQVVVGCKKVLGPDHPDTLASMSNLALVLGRQGKHEEAEAMNRQAVVGYKKVLGPDHPDTLASMDSLAGVLHNQGKHEEAEATIRQTLPRQEKVLGPDHPDTLGSMSNLALVLDRQGKHEEAEAMNRQVVVGCKKVLGPDHPDTLASMGNLALVLDRQGKHEEAEAMNRQAVVGYKKVLGPDHPNTLASMDSLAGVLHNQGKHEEAEATIRQTLPRQEKVLGPDHPDTLFSVYGLAYSLAQQHRSAESATLYERACAGLVAVLGMDHPTTRACHQDYSEMKMSLEQDGPSRLETTEPMPVATM